MAYGLQVFDAAGNLTLDTADSLTRLIGSVTVSANGSLSDTAFLTGRPFYYLIATTSGGITPEVSFSGSTMTWTYTPTATFSTLGTFILVYGVY